MRPQPPFVQERKHDPDTMRWLARDYEDRAEHETLPHLRDIHLRRARSLRAAADRLAELEREDGLLRSELHAVYARMDRIEAEKDDAHTRLASAEEALEPVVEDYASLIGHTMSADGLYERRVERLAKARSVLSTLRSSSSPQEGTPDHTQEER